MQKSPYFWVNHLFHSSEPMTRIELATSSLPRKCSSTELHRQIKVIPNASRKQKTIFEKR